MRRIVLFVMTTLTAVVLLLGYHTSTSSKAAGGETAFISTPQAGAATGSSDSPTSVPETASAGTTAAPTPPQITTPTGTAGSSTTGSVSSSSSATATPTPSSSSSSTSSAGAGSATSSTVTGAVADTRWGPVQVQLTVQNKKITNVSVIQYPNNNGRDQEINATALPILVQETISAQSAKIDMVSGATVTSEGYLNSLQSALDQAGL
jgi:uncharacterized protein with FMN-binding domain